MKKNNPIKIRRLFLLLGILPSIVFLIIVILSLSWVHKVHLSNSVQNDLNSVYHMFYGELYEEAKLINVLADQFSEKKEVQAAFLANNRGRLQEAAQPFFRKIRADYAITHGYFHSLDKTAFLRLHNSKLFGDMINRFTLKEAEMTGAVSYGLELGPIGTLTLRVVLPWRINGQVAGYIELGREIDHITRELKKILGIDLVLVVNKSHLSEENWDKGSELRGHADRWSHFPDSVVINTTLQELPPVIATDLTELRHSHKDMVLDFNMNNRQYLAGFAPLLDASDKNIGNIIIIKDFTEVKAVSNRLTNFLLAGYFFCILLYITFIFIYSRRIKLKITRLIEDD